MGSCSRFPWVSEEELDKAEDHDKGYQREDAFVVVSCTGDKKITASTYLARPEAHDENLLPYDWYRALIVAGALEHELPESYVAALRDAVVRADPDAKRREKNSAASATIRLWMAAGGTGMTISKPVKIAPGYDNSDWKALKLDRAAPDTPNWRTAVGILKARIHDRFLDPADALIELGKKYRPQRFGFAVLAIDFLVIETLQGFRDGLVDHKRKSGELFTKFLTGWDVFTNCVPRDRDPQTLARQVYHDYRCVLLHSGSTKCTFRVGVSGTAFAFNGEDDVKINRTELHKNLKRAFTLYLDELQAPDGKDLRRNFKIKMDGICGA